MPPTAVCARAPCAPAAPATAALTRLLGPYESQTPPPRCARRSGACNTRAGAFGVFFAPPRLGRGARSCGRRLRDRGRRHRGRVCMKLTCDTGAERAPESIKFGRGRGGKRGNTDREEGCGLFEPQREQLSCPPKLRVPGQGESQAHIPSFAAERGHGFSRPRARPAWITPPALPPRSHRALPTPAQRDANPVTTPGTRAQSLLPRERRG